MAIFPRWNHLKHFNSVSTTKFTDGNAFFDILKVRGTIFEFITMLIILVHYPMYCGFSPKKFLPCTLHSGLCYISDPCWPDMHDRITSGVSAECSQGLPKVLRCKLSCPLFQVLNCDPISPGSWAAIWEEFRLSKATCLITCVSRHSRERYNGQLLNSDRWRLSTGSSASVWADKYEERGASSKCFRLL